MFTEARQGELGTRGSYVHSNLGAAIAGQAVAAKAGMSCSELMRARLFEPLGMTHTVVKGRRPLVACGQAQTGLPVRPWVMTAYAPAGGVVSTIGDLAAFALAVAEGRAPGKAALEPTVSTRVNHTRIGIFWQVTTEPDRPAIT